MKLVSIITPVYNSEKYLKQNIDSVRAQTYSNWEQIFVDDCSTDNSAVIIQSHKKEDDRIKYYCLNQNSGAGVARNKAIENASGKYIAFLDSDDLWHPKKLELQIKFMEEKGCPFSFTAYQLVNESGNKINKTIKTPSQITYKRALYKNPIGCLTAVYDIDFFGKQYMPNIRKRQDFALWLKLLKKSDAYGLEKVLASYRTGNQSISSNKMDLIKYEWRVYRELENLSFVKSSFYLVSAIFLKLKSYF
ncbi:glycosyltransferase [Muricauda sp. 2012CJ35-5]|uniref:Glycosyltransferase n=1 Tax=Flagellimonas spongiicola TaxID=2942208 RepID=A0ABT0PSC2_9FLAO|nr:glycosyltransferase family 2 protein [Allomuricauda spongiicola]MCL6274289.1 glycosyltransferase [Allomuricauda spongiicola]